MTAIQKDHRDYIEPYRDPDRSGASTRRRLHTFEDVLDQILLGEMLFWPGEKSCMVTEIVQYQGSAQCTFFGCW